MVKKYNKQILFSLLAVVLAIICVLSSSLVAFAKEPVSVNNQIEAKYNVRDDGYVIENFSATIDCSSGRKAEITEIIDVNFIEESKGIHRDLTMASGEDYFGIKVEGAEAKLEKRNDILIVKMYADDYGIVGNHTFKISYKVTMPKYKESKDSLLYNIVPLGFDTVINNFTVDFTMPVALGLDKIQVVSGFEGSNVNSHAKVVVNDNKVKFTSTKPLDAFQGVSVRMNFPEGTLKNVVNLEPLYIFLFGAVIFLVAIIMLFIYGRDDQIVEVVRFDPPYNMPPSDLGYLIDGNISNEDITNLFLYWASLGAMEIHEEKRKITFIKKGELPDKCKAYEKDLFAKLFMFGEVVDPTNINEAFIMSVQRTKSTVKKSFAGKFYTRKSQKVANVFMIISVLFVVISALLADYLKYGLFDLSISFLGIIIGFVIAGYYELSKHIMESILKITDKGKRTMYFMLFGLLGVVIAVGGMFALSVMQKFTLAKSFCMIICPVLTCWIAPYIHKRTPEYNQILGEILGFRNFILIAEKDRLEALVKENPTYYYDILPFANVLGVTDILSKKFKHIKMDMPFWYTSDIDLFDIYIINNISRDITLNIARQVTEVAAAAVSSKVSKYGGGSSGSGFGAGGGFGGGGGGRL